MLRLQRTQLLALLATLACSQSPTPDATGSASLAEREEVAARHELIPAEWTVAEDTSSAGEVTTASVQLPAAREIGGLVAGEEPRLILRCLDGKVEAFIATDSSAEPSGEDSTAIAPVRIELDSAPACE